MVARGRVQNGVVVLDGGVRLPEGQGVTVVAPSIVPALPANQGSAPHSLLDVPAVSLGPALGSVTDADDLLGEMLDGRP